MINTKTVGMLVAAFAAGAIVASPELRAYAANMVGSADIINSIQSVRRTYRTYQIVYRQPDS